jgi:hypothetical protein
MKSGFTSLRMSVATHLQSGYVCRYDVYTDESYLKKEFAFSFGALICTPRRSEILTEKIDQLRSQIDYYGEFKWNKIANHNIELYRQFAGIFLEDKFARFRYMRVKKTKKWNQWGKSEEERFLKSYYVFLKQNLGPFSRYCVYPDELPFKRNTDGVVSIFYLINHGNQIGG